MMMFALLLAAASGTSGAACDPAARAVVARYYAAIERHDYGTAYRLWDRNGAASGQSAGGFARGYARTAHVRAWTGRSCRIEGAAGSSYATLPVDVRAVLTNGTRQHFTGTYVLRAVNDVPGATAEQRRWHLYSAKLTAAKRGAPGRR